MDLYLVRHGKAEQGDQDELRELTHGGRRAVERITQRLVGHVNVDRIETSPLIRARQTAEILAASLSVPLIEVSDLVPGSDVNEVRERITSETADALMLVGHNPFMEELAALLLCEDHAELLLIFHTSTIAKLIPTGDPSGRRYSCDWLLAPALLK